MKYVVQQFGDIRGEDEFGSLEEALRFVDQITKNEDGVGNYCDPEDNRITITKKEGDLETVVWHFSGWHWNENDFGIPQGKLLGRERSLYDESNY